MAFKEISDTDSTIALGGTNKKTGKPNPTSITGYFLGTKEVKTEYGPAQLHNLKTENGNVGVWGKTDLNKKMTAVPEGALVRITQSGMQKMPGKNAMYKYKVEVDTSDMLTSEASDMTVEEENDALASEDDFYEEEAVDADEESADEVSYKRATPKKTAPSVDADRQARTKALLSKGQNATK
jgi:hypothetical protein